MGLADKQQSAWQNRIVGYGTKPADQFEAHPRNWRKHPQSQRDALASSLNGVGWVGAVIENVRTGHVLDGHERIWQALERNEDVPYLQVDVSEDEELLVLATFDPITQMAVTDAEMLEGLLADLRTSELVQDDDALDALLASIASERGMAYAASEVADDPGPQIDRAEELREQWGTERGQVWEIPSKSVPGCSHRLMCGDSTSAEDVGRLMAGEKAVCMWTDPPYGVNYVGKTKDALTIQNDGSDGLPALLKNAFANAGRVLLGGAPFYVAHPAGAQQLTFLQVVSDLGWKIHEQLVWVKDSMVLGHSDYHYMHEPILYGWTPGEGRPGRGDHAGTRWYGNNSQVSVFEIPRPKRSEDHPTMKPPELVEMMLRNSTRQGEVVYEPFSGSGTTIVACERLGRSCRAVEVDPAYVAVTLQRLSDMGLEPRRANEVSTDALEVLG